MHAPPTQSEPAQIHFRQHDALLPLPSRRVRLEEVGLPGGTRRRMGETDVGQKETKEQEIRGGSEGLEEEDARGRLAEA